MKPKGGPVHAAGDDRGRGNGVLGSWPPSVPGAWGGVPGARHQAAPRGRDQSAAVPALREARYPRLDPRVDGDARARRRGHAHGAVARHPGRARRQASRRHPHRLVEYSPNRLDLIAELGLIYDSSLMADDVPYEVLSEGRATGIVELPVEWILDDYRFFGMDRFSSTRPYTPPSSTSPTKRAGCFC